MPSLVTRSSTDTGDSNVGVARVTPRSVSTILTVRLNDEATRGHRFQLMTQFICGRRQHDDAIAAESRIRPAPGRQAYDSRFLAATP